MRATTPNAFRTAEPRRQLIGSSDAIRQIQQEVDYATDSDAKVLILGESGVGKEVVASLIHHGSRRHLAPFVPINCAGVPDTLLESELFGHVRGSFTDAHRDQKGWIEQAKGGTVFLDEVGEMSVRMQAVLLRFLESGEIQRVGAERSHSVVDVRVIAATNRTLWSEVSEKRFREDLYYRLNVVHIVIPPLRERREDVRPLLQHFLEAASAAHRVPMPQLSDEMFSHLEDYNWPGNVRELKNVAERLVIRARGGAIHTADLPKEIVTWRRGAPAAAASAAATVASPLFDRMVIDGESFWSVIYEPFMSRDITRDDLREVVSRGLEHTKGSYKMLVELFNIQPSDYKRLLAFLRKHECHMPFQKFRAISVRPESIGVDSSRARQTLEAPGAPSYSSRRVAVG
jgi:DNA-binding NtrC family response regulator